MASTLAASEHERAELQLFIEDLACNVCRFRHAVEQSIEPGAVPIRREFQIGITNAFSDIIVDAPGAPYVVEVKYGYSLDRIKASLSRKYSRAWAGTAAISKLVLVYDSATHPDESELTDFLRRLIPKGWDLELWSELRLTDLAQRYMGAELDALNHNRLQEARGALERAKG